ncbi:MAG: hypothetical protein LM577_07735 [Thermoproteaceae archaeon]|jgi:hypothetical protein|nr:hypothetical protein [Thermoproteaceae archaeon]
MEQAAESPLQRLRELRQRLEGAGARSILNYVLYEFEVGGPSIEILEEAERMARQEMEELREVLRALEELRGLIA